jgi:hypothetical protein
LKLGVCGDVVARPVLLIAGYKYVDFVVWQLANRQYKNWRGHDGAILEVSSVKKNLKTTDFK